MTLNHVHFQVRDLNAAVRWFASVPELKAGFHNERIATFSFDAMMIIIDAALVDAPATLGFESDDCDRDFQAVIDGIFQGSRRDQVRDRGAARQRIAKVDTSAYLDSTPPPERFCERRVL